MLRLAGLQGPSFVKWILFLILATNCFLCFAVIHNGGSHVRPPRLPKKICRTETCKQIASSILQNMNRDADPCDDFFEFACGNFTKNAVIAEDRSTNDLFTASRDKVQEQIRNGIENQVTRADPQAFQVLQSYYKTCMNEGEIEKTSESEFLNILGKLGGWPILLGKSWDESTFDWQESMYKFRETGYSFNMYFTFGIGSDKRNASKKIVLVDQPSLGIAQEYLSQGLDEKIVKAYFKYMVEFAESFGIDRVQAEKELGESLNFEIALAKNSLPATERRNISKLYTVMTVDELQQKYPLVSWLDYMNAILQPQAQISNNDELMLGVPSFFDNLGDLIAKTPKRVLANYAYWRVAAESAGQLSDRLRRLKREFNAALSGSAAERPRWQDCVDLVQNHLHVATGALFVRKYFPKNTKNEASQMTEDIRASFRQMMTEIDWMDKETKKAALEKLDEIIPLIAYPDEFFDDEKLNNHYKNLNIYPESLLKSVLSYSLFEMAREFEQLRDPIDKRDWTGLYGAAAVVNAFYNPTTNTIQMPAGMLQAGSFNANNPKYVNYAGIGSILGHEMTHGFDDTGRQFDKDGNLIDWWKPETKTEYLKRTECIINQYGNYTVKQVGLKINGIRTQGENIADNGGVKEAYRAYETWSKRYGPDPRLPGLETFTPNQMFWISNARVWCAKYRTEYLRNLVLTNPHAPAQFRIIGPISNMPAFAKDFRCAPGSPMNPAHRCTVW